MQTERVHGLLQKFTSRAVNSALSATEPISEAVAKDSLKFGRKINNSYSFDPSFDFHNPTLSKSHMQPMALAKKSHKYQELLQQHLLKEYQNDIANALKPSYELLVNPKEGKYLYARMSKDYALKVRLPELKRRYRYLAARKAQFAPVRLGELREHGERHMRLLEKNAKAKMREQEESELLSEQYMLKAGSYKSKFTNDVLAHDKLEQRKDKLIAANKKDNYERKALYSKIVRSGYLFDVKLDKFRRIENIIQAGLKRNAFSTPVKKKVGFVEISPRMKESARCDAQAEKLSKVTSNQQKSIVITIKNEGDLMQTENLQYFKPKYRYNYINAIRSKLSLLDS